MYENELRGFMSYEHMTAPKPKIYKSKGKQYDDNIYTFDIETISLYEINGELVPFDYDRGADYYKMHEKVACCYLWMFGANHEYYYGRELDDFETVLRKLSNPVVTKYIYIHNLQYETQWMLDIFIRNKWTVSELCARQKRQPIQYKIEELNIIFRCSQQLTNLSLEKASEKYTDLKKAVGELDYNIPYSPLSKLPNNVLYYGLMDVKTLTHIIEYFKCKYKHIKQIPLTQTGEVRKSLQKECGYWYVKKQQEKTPPLRVYQALTMAFCGGISHGNILYINKTITGGVWSFDYSSSYPYIMTCFKLPMTPFRLVTKQMADTYKANDTHAILYHVRFKNLKSRYYNHYIPHYKMVNIEGREVIDNGRLHSLKGACEMVLTDYDLEMIEHCYDIDEIEYINIWASYKDYLEPEAIRFIITRYADKTTLKGVEGQEEFYTKQKQELNSCFGMSAQNILKTGVTFDVSRETLWGVEELTDEFIQEKLNGMKTSWSTLFYPMAVGTWITAIGRYNLFSCITGLGYDSLDKDVIYYDTDSIKGRGDSVYKLVHEYNENVEKRIRDSAERNNLDISLYRPKDIKGVEHPIGYFENETDKGLYTAFKTLGAKKYMYQTPDGENHLTMSGVRKSAVKYLTFDTFKNGTLLGYDATGKLIRYYNDEQPNFTYRDIDGHVYTCKQKHAIILQPTTYLIGQTEEFTRLIAEYEGYIGEF